ncbi:hypothetical protein C1H46_001090 [Malus baccata]|uniref:Ubiquitin-like protease family profile domain-containing protein n=1 Tax=Malus baccata TaxID=106549 RepID=A0A540NRN8_MALBA|nr:hypothetical protein C1H46_001090 [Malus baccata]
MQLLVQQITPTEEEKSAPYWKAMFDEVEPCREGNCGVFLLKFVNHISMGMAIDDIASQNMRFFGLKFVIEFMRGRGFMWTTFI